MDEESLYTESIYTQDDGYCFDGADSFCDSVDYGLYDKCIVHMTEAFLDSLKLVPRSKRLRIWIDGLDDAQIRLIGMTTRDEPYSLIAITLYEIIYNLEMNDPFMDQLLEDYGLRYFTT